MKTFLALVVGVSAGVALAVTLGGRAIADDPLGATTGDVPAPPEPPAQPVVETETVPPQAVEPTSEASQAMNSAVQATQEGALR